VRGALLTKIYTISLPVNVALRSRGFMENKK
jgi:hypothetical protein